MAKRFYNLLTNSTRTETAINRFKATSANVNLRNERIVDPDLSTAKPYNQVPSVPALPFLGTAWNYMPVLAGKYDPLRRHDAHMKIYQKYGKIVREDLTPNTRMLHVFDPHDIEKVYRHEGRYPLQMDFETMKFYRESRKDIFSNSGLMAEQGEKWYEIRTKVQKHMLRPASVQYYLPVMDKIAQEMVQRMEFLMDNNGEVPELINEMYKWALEAISSVALDANLGCLKNDMTKESESWKMITAVNEMFALMNKLESSGFQLWKYLPSPKMNKYLKIMDYFSNTAQKHIKTSLDKLENLSSENRELTLLENFLVKEKMDMGHVIAMITDMLFAGIDTTSHSIAFAMYHLAKNPDAQENLFEELRKVLREPTSPITVPVLNESRYLKACVKESMRLNPISTNNHRILDKDIVLSGYRIPAGVVLLLEDLVACRLEENFPEPMKFKPERWLRDVNEHKPNSFLVLSFGFGPRACIGKRIAEQEIWSLLIRIIQKYRVEYHYEDIDMHSGLVNSPDKPLRLKFIRR